MADKPLVWLHGEIKTPPFSRAARIEAGFLLRRLQRGEQITMPASRAMPEGERIAMNCAYLMETSRGGFFTARSLTRL
jgi:hypothetical protein